MPVVDPVAALRRIAFLLERSLEPTYRVRAFRRAAAATEPLDPAELSRLAPGPGLRALAGIGEVTERVIREALADATPVYLRRLEAIEGQPVAGGAADLRAALRGDCHTHSSWSDGAATSARWPRPPATSATTTSRSPIPAIHPLAELLIRTNILPEALASSVRAV